MLMFQLPIKLSSTIEPGVTNQIERNDENRLRQRIYDVLMRTTPGHHLEDCESTYQAVTVRTDRESKEPWRPGNSS